MGNPIPVQSRSVDPFSSYNSDIVNKLTRIVSNGNDCILYPQPIEVQINDSTSVIATEGNCIKDDVLIEISSLTIDMTDTDFYVQPSGGVWNETGYYYIVLHYVYQKTRPAPYATIKVILPSQRASLFTSEYLFLSCLSVSAPGGIHQVDEVLDLDPTLPSNGRTIAGSAPGGGELALFKTISGSYTVTPEDKNIKVVGNATITLPLLADAYQQLRIIKADSSTTTLTVVGSGGETIDNNTSIQIRNQWNEITLLPNRSDGVWIEI